MSPLAHTRRITLELSNWCNLAPHHHDCPASHAKGKQKLAAHVIDDVVTTAGDLGFRGAFAWHMYNEPCSDMDRLLHYCNFVREVCPTSKGTLLWTNGDYLTVDRVKDLVAAGVYCFRVSLYTREAAARLRAIALDTPKANWHFSAYIQGFDSRIKQYDTKIQDNPYRPCYAPLTDITINHKGEVVLCCMDWKGENSFANLHRMSFLDFVDYNADVARSIQRNLAVGVRTLGICRGCTLERESRPDEVSGCSSIPKADLELDNRTTNFDPRLK